MKKEWNTEFIHNMERIKRTTLNNSHITEEFLPKYILKREFFEEFTKDIEKSFKEKEFNPYLKFSSYQEFRIITLINCLNTAKEKYLKNKSGLENQDIQLGMLMDIEVDKSEFSVSESNTSQMKLVNDIIKDSYELTSYIYLIEWLQRIYLKDDPVRTGVRERVFFLETSRKLIGNKNKNVEFHPDILNFKNQVINPEEMEKFNKLMEVIVILIRQGNLEEAQKTAEYYNQPFISGMLNGGLPMNDFILDKSENLKDLDFDLFPPFMKTKDLSFIKNNINKFSDVSSQYENIFAAHDHVIGNPNWILWFYSIYSACDSIHEKESVSQQMKLLQSYLSGNPSFIERSNINIYDFLYSNVSTMLNFKLIAKYSQKGKILNYHFVDQDEPDLDKYFNKLVKGKTVIDVINIIKSKEKFKDAIKQDFILDLEFEIIQLHFLDYKRNHHAYLERLNNLLHNIILTFNENQIFEDYLRTYNNFIENSIHHRSDLKLSQNEIQMRNESQIQLMRLNYMRLIFNTIITFYATNSSKFQVVEGMTNEDIDLRASVLRNYDCIISIYFDEMSNFIIKSNEKLKPQHLVYILGYCFDIHSVQNNLTILAQKLKESGEENYINLVREIDIHFKEYMELLNTNIANNTHIYLLPPSICSIDEILKNDLDGNLKISREDEIKINQVKSLFIEGKLEKVTILKYILKLSLKFLSNNKFHEAQKLEKEFEDSLNVSSILGVAFVKKNNLDRDDLNFIFLLENSLDESENFNKLLNDYGIDFYNIGIYFTILFTKFVLNCYFDFKILVENVFRESKSNVLTNYTQNMLNDKTKNVIKKFNNLIKLIRILVSSQEIKDILINFFSDEVFLDDILQIISKWIFQILKWCSELYTQETFKILNMNSDDGLNLILDLLVVKDEILLKNYILDNHADFLENEKSFFRFLDPSHEKRKEVFTFIHQLGKINKNLLSEVLDDELHNDLTKDLNNYEF